MSNEEQRIVDGVLFAPWNPDLVAMKGRSHELSRQYNLLAETEKEKRQQILEDMLGGIGEGTYIQGPVTFHYGKHTSIGEHTFINFNFTVQDDAHVSIGDHCDFGPNVTIVTPIHPLIASERRALRDRDGNMSHAIYARPVKIGNDCWFGANVVVCPGVTIGDNVVIGAGSVVTRDIESDSFAAGVPCKVIRKITEQDSMKYKPEILADYSVE